MEPKRISRRELLRTIGLAGAMAWTAPIVSSMPASASIAWCPRKWSRKLCKGWPFGNCTNGYGQCGICSSDVGDGSFCFEDTRGKNMCAEDVFCAEAGRCVVDADCKAQGLGNICITSNGCTGCSREWAVCSTRCCVGLARPGGRARPRRLGKTASGR
jgi:hypothetical protein